MKALELKKGSKALVVIAHPDDETIWMGGTIISNSAADWTIYSLSRASDADRAPKFRRVCVHYGARPIIGDLADDGSLKLNESVPVIMRLIRKQIKSAEFDYVFTHGDNGEYGHVLHKGTHSAVKRLFRAKKLAAGNLVFFHYQNSSRSIYSRLKPRNSPDVIFKLNKKTFLAKLNVMSEIYGFAPQGIDAGYCTNPEAFKFYY